MYSGSIHPDTPQSSVIISNFGSLNSKLILHVNINRYINTLLFTLIVITPAAAPSSNNVSSRSTCLLMTLAQSLTGTRTWKIICLLSWAFKYGTFSAVMFFFESFPISNSWPGKPSFSQLPMSNTGRLYQISYIRIILGHVCTQNTNETVYGISIMG